MNWITFSYPNLITGELLSSLLLCQSPSGSTFRRMPVAKPSCCHQIVSTRADAAAGHVSDVSSDEPGLLCGDTRTKNEVNQFYKAQTDKKSCIDREYILFHPSKLIDNWDFKVNTSHFRIISFVFFLNLIDNYFQTWVDALLYDCWWRFLWKLQ